MVRGWIEQDGKKIPKDKNKVKSHCKGLKQQKHIFEYFWTSLDPIFTIIARYFAYIFSVFYVDFLGECKPLESLSSIFVLLESH